MEQYRVELQDPAGHRLRAPRQGVKDGRFPKPVKLGVKTTAWRVEDIRDLIERLGR